jgi:hypothetical protein
VQIEALLCGALGQSIKVALAQPLAARLGRPHLRLVTEIPNVVHRRCLRRKLGDVLVLNSISEGELHGQPTSMFGAVAGQAAAPYIPALKDGVLRRHQIKLVRLSRLSPAAVEGSGNDPPPRCLPFAMSWRRLVMGERYWKSSDLIRKTIPGKRRAAALSSPKKNTIWSNEAQRILK